MKKKTAILAALCALSISAVSAISTYADDAKLLAFPGAVGGGMYTEGARAAGEGNIEVYHVTNLKEKGEGSFADAVSKEGRIIVFDVGGVIELKSTLKIRNSNLTILGQTAPGDGITFLGGDISISDGVENIIIRHIRVRPTDKYLDEPDALGGRWNKNIILDHCSMSWSVDEGMTLYAGYSNKMSNGKELERGNHITVQNCISSESLRMSKHFKGAHGYGAIVGAIDSTWVNNLFAHHDSRSPRVDAAVKNTDFSNNVIYNWGITNSAYGAQPKDGSGYIEKESTMNWTNNYYKYGPGTKASIRNKIFEVSNTDTDNAPYLKFYFDGNYVCGYDDVTKNNTIEAGVKNYQYTKKVTSKNDMGDYAYTEKTAEEAYEYVLGNAGATLPKRDAIDARVIADVENQTGRIINSADEVGGWIPVETVVDKFEIPSEWIKENDYSGYDAADIIPTGYTLIEEYVNWWTAQQEKTQPTNPKIEVTSPTIAAIDAKGEVNSENWHVTTSNSPITYSATAIAVSGVEVTKMELYDRNECIGIYNDSSKINVSLKLEPGVHYLTCRAYNKKGEKTQSPTSIVYVNSPAIPDGFEYTEIGTSKFPNKGAAWFDESTGVYTVAGAGKLFGTGLNKGVDSDVCGFMYKKIRDEFDITVKIEDIPKFENHQVSGLMVRSSVDDAKSVMAMIADGWLKLGENIRVISRETKGGKSDDFYFKDADGIELHNEVEDYVYNYIDSTTGERVSKKIESYDTSEDAFKLPKYMKIERKGNTLTFSVSDSGTDWNDNPRQPLSITYSDLPEELYVGLAVDSAQGTPTKEYFAQAKFSELTITQDGESVGEKVLRPVSEPTKWVFDDYAGDKDVDYKNYYTENTLLGDHMLLYTNANNKIEIEGNRNKEINGIKYTSRLRLGKAGVFDGDIPTARVVEIKPVSDGVVEVAFDNGSTSSPGTMTIKQNGKVIGEHTVEKGDFAHFSCKVKGGNSVYIYSNGNLNLYGIYYIPTEVSSSYVSFVSEGTEGTAGSSPFDQSHIIHNGIRLLRYGSDDEGKGGKIYGNTISTGFTASITPGTTKTGMSYEKIAWDVTIPVADTYVKVPHGTDMNALMLSDMIDPGEYYIPVFDYEEDVSEEIIIGDEVDPLEDAALSETFLDWGMADIPTSSEEEIIISEEPAFTDEQLMEFAEFADSAKAYRASAWNVSVGVEEDNAVLTDSEKVEQSSKGAIYKVASVDEKNDEEIQIQLQYSSKTVFTGESTITVGLIIDNLYAPSATANVMYYRENDVVSSDYKDLSNDKNAVIAHSYSEYQKKNQ